MNAKKTRAQLVDLLGRFQRAGKEISQEIQELDEKEKHLTQEVEQIRELRRTMALTRRDAVSGIVGTTRDIMALDSLNK